MDKKFYLPGYYQKYDLIYHLIKYRDQYPERFIEDRIIAGAYDMPPGLAWNGGRVNLATNPDYVKARTYNMMKFYFNQSDFTLLHTCTNFLADINDIDSYEFIQKYYRPQDKIILTNPALKDFLQSKISDISFVWSTTLLITDLNEVNKLTQDDGYVIAFEKNIDDDYLKKIEHPENIEILCAETCQPNCPNRERHYHLISKLQTEKKESKPMCTYAKTVHWKTAEEMINSNECRVSSNRINELSSMGFSQFKLNGRTLPDFLWLQVIIYYLVKDEYKKQVYNDLLEEYKKIHYIQK